MGGRRRGGWRPVHLGRISGRRLAQLAEGSLFGAVVPWPFGDRLVEVEVRGGAGLVRSKSGDWSKVNSVWGGPRAGVTGGGRWARSKCRTMVRTVGGSVMNERILISP